MRSKATLLTVDGQAPDSGVTDLVSWMRAHAHTTCVIITVHTNATCYRNAVKRQQPAAHGMCELHTLTHTQSASVAGWPTNTHTHTLTNAYTFNLLGVAAFHARPLPVYLFGVWTLSSSSLFAHWSLASVLAFSAEPHERVVYKIVQIYYAHTLTQRKRDAHADAVRVHLCANFVHTVACDLWCHTRICAFVCECVFALSMRVKLIERLCRSSVMCGHPRPVLHRTNAACRVARSVVCSARLVHRVHRKRGRTVPRRWSWHVWAYIYIPHTHTHKDSALAKRSRTAAAGFPWRFCVCVLHVDTSTTMCILATCSSKKESSTHDNQNDTRLHEYYNQKNRLAGAVGAAFRCFRVCVTVCGCLIVVRRGCERKCVGRTGFFSCVLAARGW